MKRVSIAKLKLYSTFRKISKVLKMILTLINLYDVHVFQLLPALLHICSIQGEIIHDVKLLENLFKNT